MEKCSSFQTFAGHIPTGPVDRVVGALVKTTTLTRTNNVYNVSIYGNIVNDTIHGGLFIFPTAGTNAFKIVAAIGVGNQKMVKQDMIAQLFAGDTLDFYTVAKGVSNFKHDLEQGCKNDITVISASGAAFDANKKYQHFFFTRKLDTGDTGCDTTITNTTEMCAVLFESQISDASLARHQLEPTCGVFATLYGMLLTIGFALISFVI